MLNDDLNNTEFLDLLSNRILQEDTPEIHETVKHETKIKLGVSYDFSYENGKIKFFEA